MTAPASSFATRLFIGLVVLIVVVGGVGGLIASAKQARQREAWQAFKVEHRCKAVSHRDGELVTTVANDAKGPGTVGKYMTPGRTGWLCDDGVVREMDDV